MGSEKIYLLGFMGCGKSTFGKKLAKKLDWTFVDMDDFIESQEGMTIGELFKAKGESYFRLLESQVLKDSASWSNTIISTGGGAPCFHDNISIINKQGISVYINLPAKVLVDRLKGEKTKRPLLASLNDEEMLRFVESKLSERAIYYEQAQVNFEYLKEKEADFIVRIKKLMSY